MLLTRSGEIVDWVWLTGIVAPDFRRRELLPGWQSMKYSPMSDWGRVSHCTSERSCEVARLGDLELDERLLGPPVDLHVGDLSRAHAGDLHVGALGQAEGVVQLHPVALVAVVVALRAAGDQHEGAGSGEDQGDGDRALHGPGGSWVGSQMSFLIGLLPSWGRSIEPGQRLVCPVWANWRKLLATWLGGMGAVDSRRVELEGVDVEGDAADPAVGVVEPVWEKSLNQPTRSGA